MNLESYESGTLWYRKLQKFSWRWGIHCRMKEFIVEWRALLFQPTCRLKNFTNGTLTYEQSAVFLLALPRKQSIGPKRLLINPDIQRNSVSAFTIDQQADPEAQPVTFNDPSVSEKGKKLSEHKAWGELSREISLRLASSWLFGCRWLHDSPTALVVCRQTQFAVISARPPRQWCSPSARSQTKFFVRWSVDDEFSD